MNSFRHYTDLDAEELMWAANMSTEPDWQGRDTQTLREELSDALSEMWSRDAQSDSMVW